MRPWLCLALLCGFACAKPDAAAVRAPATPAPAGRSAPYVACGCGCCGGVQPTKQCLYRARGDDLDAIVARDVEQRRREACRTMGCSRGVEYRYCE